MPLHALLHAMISECGTYHPKGYPLLTDLTPNN